MDWQRIVLIGSIITLSFMLLLEWNKFSERHNPGLADSEITTSTSSSTQSELPTPATTIETINNQGDAPAPSTTVVGVDKGSEVNDVIAAEVTPNSQLIRVVTDTLEILIDTHGGDIVKVALLEHAAQLNSDQPYVLLNRNNDFTYIAQSGLVGPGDDGTDSGGVRPTYTTDKSEYDLG